MNNNANNGAADRDARLEQELNALRNRYESLKERKVRTEQDIANLSRQLEELEQRALAEYGTADPKELQALLESKRQENERVVAEYRNHVQEVQQALAEVEQGFGGR